MNPHFGPAPPAPQPPPDGLATAFARADRRRLRSALASAVPVVLAAALVAAPFGGTAQTGLEPVTPPAESVTPSPSAEAEPPPASPAPTTTAPAPRGTPAATSAAGVPPEVVPADPGGGVAAADEPPIGSGVLGVSGDGTASGRFTLTGEVHVFLSEAEYEGTGELAGVYVERLDQRVGGGVLSQSRKSFAKTGWDLFGTSHRTLRLGPGEYRVWLVTEVPTRVEIPLAEGDAGFEVEATAPAATFRDSESGEARDTDAAEVRFTPENDVPAVGWYHVTSEITTFYGGARLAARVCVTPRGAACPAGTGESTAASATWTGALRRGDLDPGRPRDLLLEQTANHRAMRMAGTISVFLLYLR